MEDMEAALWGRLPSEVQERALSYLSAPVLCRFRTVCKRWNSLICNPEFGALCIRNAPQDASFLVALIYIIDKGDNESGANLDFRAGWAFLDVKARRWYTIAKPTEQELFDRFQVPNPQCCVAMAGGLVCQVLPGHENASVFVFNPIAQTEPRLLPAPKHRLEAWTVVDMIVDASTGCYSIFVLPYRKKLEDPFMIIYESRTDAWRSSSSPPITKVCVNVEYSSVCFNGLLYVLAWVELEAAVALRRDPDSSWLWSYNPVEDTWLDTGMVFPMSPPRRQTFLVSDSRLFLALWVPVKKMWTYQVSEIDLQERTLRTPVLIVTKAAMRKLFKLVLDWPNPNEMYLQAFGLEKGILVLSRTTGITRVYDLKTCTWDALRETALAPTMMSDSRSRSRIYLREPMNLVMPAASESWKKDVTEANSFPDI